MKTFILMLVIAFVSTNAFAANTQITTIVSLNNFGQAMVVKTSTNGFSASTCPDSIDNKGRILSETLDSTNINIYGNTVNPAFDRLFTIATIAFINGNNVRIGYNANLCNSGQAIITGIEIL